MMITGVGVEGNLSPCTLTIGSFVLSGITPFPNDRPMIPNNDNDHASRDDRHYHTGRIAVCPCCCGDKHQYQPTKQEFPHHRVILSFLFHFWLLKFNVIMVRKPTRPDPSGPGIYHIFHTLMTIFQHVLMTSPSPHTFYPLFHPSIYPSIYPSIIIIPLLPFSAPLLLLL